MIRPFSRFDPAVQSISLVFALTVPASTAQAESIFSFMKTLAHETQIGVYCVWNGCQSTSVLAKRFDPQGSRNHTCKEAHFGGPASAQVWMCLVESGGAISMEGDLIVVAVNRSGRRNLDVDLRCETTYTPGKEFLPKTFTGFGMVMLNDQKLHDFFILDPQLDKYSRWNWKMGGFPKCRWTVEEEKAKKPKEVVNPSDKKAVEQRDAVVPPKFPPASPAPESKQPDQINQSGQAKVEPKPSPEVQWEKAILIPSSCSVGTYWSEGGVFYDHRGRCK